MNQNKASEACPNNSSPKGLLPGPEGDEDSAQIGAGLYFRHPKWQIPFCKNIMESIWKKLDDCKSDDWDYEQVLHSLPYTRALDGPHREELEVLGKWSADTQPRTRHCVKYPLLPPVP